MPKLFELKVATKDFLGKTRKWEFSVVAADRKEVEEEIASVMALHDEVEDWHIVDTVKEAELAQDSGFAKDYVEKGHHSYYT